MQFTNGEYLYLILILPVLMYFFICRLTYTRKKMLFYIEQACLNTLVLSSPYTRIKKYVILLLSIAFLLIALSRPQLRTNTDQQIQAKGSEIMLIADVSTSMLVEDMGSGGNLSRLTVMKKELQKLVDLLKGHRIGLIAFAGSASLITPLTLDYSVVKLHLDSLSHDILHIQGTNFSTAFQAAWQAIKRGGTMDPNVPKILIVASDGEDNENTAVRTASKLFKEANIRIFTMGFGTSKGGLIPVYSQAGNKQGYKKDQKGELVRSQFNEETLKEIAQTTEGKFYSVSIGDPSVKNIYSYIQSLKQGEISHVTKGAYIELYQYFLLISLLLGSLHLLIKDAKVYNNTLKRKLNTFMDNS